jgi:hypothetical protein
MTPDRSKCWLCGAKSSTQAQRDAAGYGRIHHDGECLGHVMEICELHDLDLIWLDGYTIMDRILGRKHKCGLPKRLQDRCLHKETKE